MESTDRTDDSDSMARYRPALPAGLAEQICRLAGECGVDAGTVRLAAQLKVAVVVTGAPSLPAGADTWRDLISRLATEAGRQEAAAAWQSVAAQEYVTPGQVGGFLLMALQQLTGAPDQPHNRCILLAPAELEALVQASSGPVRQLPDCRFHQLFEDRVRRHPDAVAAVQGDRSWSYREVNRSANKIAWSLRRRGLRSENVVAVVTERTLEWLAAVLAVFKAGGCYLPLEPHFPAARLAAALSRSECRWVLAERGAAHLDEAVAGRATVAVSYLDELLAQDGPEDDPGVRVAADQLAYIYFTSGSTGEPKGAMCEHDGFLNHLLAKIEDLGIAEGSVVSQIAPQCFDISLWQLVCALLVGGRTHIVEQEVILDVRSFVAELAAGSIQIAQLVPSYLDVVLLALQEQPRDLPELRCVAVTGEALKKELVHRWFAVFPEVPLVNCFGTTEASDDTNHEVMRQVPAHRSVPLGDPIRNVRVYVMDDRLSLVPPGAPGEIMFAGVCVGRGYVNDAARTKAMFTRDPYRPAERLYRSGDFGRWLPTGELEYLGRRDSQVKVNGFRIEIGEIENRLLQVPGVRNGTVVIVGSGQEPRLVCYYTGAAAPAPEQARKALADVLPGYMVPHRLYHTRELPLLANGKIDMIALSGMAAAAAELGPDADAFEALVTGTEHRVAALWSELLKVPVQRIGRGSRFAELGGTSLSAIRLSIALDRLVTVGDLRDTPTVADVALLLDQKAVERSAAAPLPSGTCSPGRLQILLAVPGDGGSAAWAAEHRGVVRGLVAESGAVLLRGLAVASAADVAGVAAGLGIEPVAEREGFAARSTYAEAIYSSSQWPPDERMCMHHELSYASEVPGLILFGCITAPARGGETEVADAHEVLRLLPAELVAPFERDGWLLTRMYHEIGVSWTDAFGTEDPAQVDAYCAVAGLECEWLPAGRLRTRQRRAAVVRHPRTGARGWFNQIAFLNEMTLDPAIRGYLVDVYGPSGLPFNSAYGDGSPVSGDIVETINEVYRQVTISEPWQDGDVLVIDNLRMAHSREPYEGAREIVVIFGDPVRLEDHVLAWPANASRGS